MEEYIKATKQKVNQLEQEISECSATYNQKRNMFHTLSKIGIFSDDVFDDAIYYKKKANNLLHFAEWTSFESWVLKEMDLWENKNYPDLGRITSKELYKKYEDTAK